jgi:hypothetical protein
MIINDKMISIYNEINIENKTLDENLLEIIRDGFIERENCFFIKKLFEMQNHLKPTDFPDALGYECFVNSLHLDDYIKSDFIDQGLILTKEVFNKWNEKNINLVLKAVLSQTDFGANLRFYTYRNADWINENEINNFEEPLLISSSNE